MVLALVETICGLIQETLEINNNTTYYPLYPSYENYCTVAFV